MPLALLPAGSLRRVSQRLGWLVRTMSESKQPLSNMDLVRRVDTWPYFHKDPAAYRSWISAYYYFMLEGHEKPLGYMHQSILEALDLPEQWRVDRERRLLTLTGKQTFDERSNVMQATLRRAVQQELPTGPRKFYNETIGVYTEEGEHVLDMDRSGLDPFGVVSYSAHLIVYVDTPDGRKYWVPKRSKTKETVPSMLDSSVGGVKRSHESPLDCMVRKTLAETSIPAAYTREQLYACGTASYQMSITSTGSPGCQHIIHYLFEMPLTADMTPTPNDEVEKFTLMSLDEVFLALREGQFVANRAMIWLSYLIRHGIITPETEPEYTELCSRLQRKHMLFIA